MIKLQNIDKSYGSQVLFKDLSFFINKGEKVGLVGRNGHGKSTVFRMILGEEEPDSGQIIIPKGYSVGILKQHLEFSMDTVLEECCLGLPEYEDYATWKVEKVLAGLGFTEADFERSPQEFSGGYQIRMNLAKLLVSEPDILLLDEPNNYLDIVTIRWLTNFLQEWEGELILITHDRSFMDSVVTHTVAIHRESAIKITGDTEKLYTQINESEEIYEKTRLNEAKKRKQEEQFIARFKAKASFASRAQSRVKKLEKQGQMQALETIQELDMQFNSLSFSGNQMVSVQDLGFGYEGSDQIIEEFSLTVGKEDRICIVGKNGAGKSTLLKLLAGELQASSGTITKHPSLKEGYFGQTNKQVLKDSRSVYEEIMATDRSCNENKARTIAGVLMFSDDLALKKIKVLSGGEKSRVSLGKILVTPCHLLFLDEPTNHLDMQSCDSLIEAVHDFDGAVIMVTHDELHLRAIANRLIVFDEGKIRLFEGTYDEFLADVGWQSEQ